MNPSMRASDDDRDQVVAVLCEQVGTGRLTLDEFSQRSGRAYQSSMIGELDALTRDLPTPEPAPILAVPRLSASALVPVLVIVAVVVLLGCALLLASGVGAADSMSQMMNHMMGR
jgi:hypothetical protein